MTAAIAPLPPGLAAALGAAPQVPDAATAIAELVSNALDAGARRVVVQLLALGPEDVAFAVDDDGRGIAQCSFPALAQPGCTSKLHSAAQLEAGPSTLGFKVGRAAMCMHACAWGHAAIHGSHGWLQPLRHARRSHIAATRRLRCALVPQLSCASATTFAGSMRASPQRPPPPSYSSQGQALAALAAAADLEVVSRAAGGFETYAKRVRGGRVLSCSPALAPRLRQGTRVRVAEFGLGTPVRRLQLLHAASSGALVQDVKRRLAALMLPWPGVALDLLDATAAVCDGGTGADTWSECASGRGGSGGLAIMRLAQVGLACGTRQTCALQVRCQ
jgi:hypothetical protein